MSTTDFCAKRSLEATSFFVQTSHGMLLEKLQPVLESTPTAALFVKYLPSVVRQPKVDEAGLLQSFKNYLPKSLLLENLSPELIADLPASCVIWEKYQQNSALPSHEKLPKQFLYLTALKGDRTILQVLWEQDFDLQRKDQCGRSVLHHAASGGQGALMEWLISEKGFNLRAKDRYGRSVLHHGASGGQRALIEWLTDEKKFNLRAKDRYGRSVLHHAASGGQRALMEWCTGEKGFGLRRKDKCGRSVLHHAAWGGHQVLIEWLIHVKRFDLQAEDNDGKSVLHHAAWGGHQALIEWLIGEKRFDFQAKDNDGKSVLHHAAWGGHQVLIEWLIGVKRFDLQAEDNHGRSVLHYAAWGGHQALIEWLIDVKRFDLRAKDRYGSSILHDAAWGGHQTLMEWLIEKKNMNPHAKDNFGHNLSYYAKKSRDNMFLTWIKELLTPYTIQANALKIPFAIEAIETPKSSWKELLMLAEKPENEPFQSGLQDLYNRLQEQRRVPSVSGADYYPRFKQYIGLIIDYIRKNPAEEQFVLEALSRLQGLCGGVREDVEILYFTHCKKREENDWKSALISIAWQWRMMQLLGYINSSFPDRHQAFGIREGTARALGLPLPVGSDPLKEQPHPQTIKDIVESILDHYPRALAQMLLDLLKEPKPSKHLTIGDHSSSFQEVLTDTMLEHECLPKEFQGQAQAAFDDLRKKVEREEGDSLCDELFFSTIDKETFLALDRDLMTVLKIVDTPGLRKVFLYPIAQKLWSRSDILRFLVKIDWLRPAKETLHEDWQ